MAAFRAFNQITANHNIEGYQIVVDGNEYWFSGCTPIVKGDDLIPAISMASIVAKLHRDTLMSTLSTHYPDWQFEYHVGYGTEYHRRQIAEHGLLSGIHRATFCTRIGRKKNTTC